MIPSLFALSMEEPMPVEEVGTLDCMATGVRAPSSENEASVERTTMFPGGTPQRREKSKTSAGAWCVCVAAAQAHSPARRRPEGVLGPIFVVSCCYTGSGSPAPLLSMVSQLRVSGKQGL